MPSFSLRLNPGPIKIYPPMFILRIPHCGVLFLLEVPNSILVLSAEISHYVRSLAGCTCGIAMSDILLHAVSAAFSQELQDRTA